MTVTEEQYLVIDRAVEFRHELLDGEIVALPGGNIRHAQLRMNLICELHARVRGTHCEVFGCDLRVRVSRRTFTCPDLTIVCGSPIVADERQDILLNPTVIIEVLSPSTEHYDRGIKLRYCRTIESLRDYILIAQDQIRVEQYARGEANTWNLRDYQDASEKLQIESIGVSVPIARLYERVDFPPE